MSSDVQKLKGIKRQSFRWLAEKMHEKLTEKHLALWNRWKTVLLHVNSGPHALRMISGKLSKMLRVSPTLMA